jgi:hypothetical protein
VAKQTSNNGPSQAASTKAVTFSRQSAQRIAKVVRTVEAGNRDQPGIRFDHPQPGMGPNVSHGHFHRLMEHRRHKSGHVFESNDNAKHSSAYNVLPQLADRLATRLST